jgi:hypothetical protein
MRAGDIRGTHPHWEQYFNGHADHDALQQIRGIGPARSALILRLYGGIDTFLQADPEDVARRSRGLIGAGLAAEFQRRSLDAGLRSDWSRLQAANRNPDSMVQPRGFVHRLRAFLEEAGPSPWDQLAGALARLPEVVRSLTAALPPEGPRTLRPAAKPQLGHATPPEPRPDRTMPAPRSSAA